MDQSVILNTLQPIFEDGCAFMEVQNKLTEEIIDWLKNVRNVERGNGKRFPIFPKTPMASRKPKKRSLSSIINDAADFDESSDTSSLKPSRSAAQNATYKITKHVQASLKDKMRRPTRLLHVPEGFSNVDVLQEKSTRFGPICSVKISPKTIDISSPFSCGKSISTVSVTSGEHENCNATKIIIHGNESKRDPSTEAEIKAVTPSSRKKSRDSIDMPMPVRCSKRVCTISPTSNGEENFEASKIVVQDGHVKTNSQIDTTSEHTQSTAKSKGKILVVTSPIEKKKNHTFHRRSSSTSVPCDNDGSKKPQSAVPVVSIVKDNYLSNNEHVLTSHPVVVLKRLKMVTPQSLTNDRKSMSNSSNERSSYRKRITEKNNSKSSPVLKLTDKEDKSTCLLQNDPHVKSPPVSKTTSQGDTSAYLLHNDHPVKSPLVSKTRSQGDKSPCLFQSDPYLNSPSVPKTTGQENKSTPLLQTYHDFEDKVQKLQYNSSCFKSVMKSVAAYEKLNFEEGQNNAPARITRTKAKAIAAAAAKASQNSSKNLKNQGNRDLLTKLARVSLARAKKTALTKHQKNREAEASKENSVVFSQSTLSGVNSTLKKLKKTPFTTPRVLMDRNYALFCNSTNGKVRCENIQEQIEEERNKIEIKESQALQRKEDLLKLKTEESKRKREEKVEKVTLIRKANENEKLKYQQQVDKEKREKEKHVEEEREARLKKKQERLQAAAKMHELRKLEKTKQKKQEEEKQNALKKQKEETYLKLNAEEEKTWEKAEHILEEQANNTKSSDSDCNQYDIGHIKDGDSDDDEERPKSRVPLWASRPVRSATVQMQQSFPAKLYRSLFASSGIAPPDLSEMFRGINKHLLLRSSSAHWTTPPRYSTLPKF